jgi:Papain family cysteine protease
MATLILPNGKSHGWKRDTPSHNDWEMADALFKGVKPTLAITGPVGFLDRSQHPKVRDQGAYGSCTGHGTRGALQTMMIKRGLKQVELSPRQIYFNGRAKEASIPEDSGCEIRDVIDETVRLGAAREADCPYPKTDKEWPLMKRPPSQKAAQGAQAHQIKVNRYRVRTLDEFLQALANKMAIVGGFTCFSDTFDRQDGYLPFPRPGVRVTGGHCVLYLTADPGQRIVGHQGSWSPDWGNGGYGTQSFEWLERKLISDSWACDHE